MLFVLAVGELLVVSHADTRGLVKVEHLNAEGKKIAEHLPQADLARLRQCLVDKG